MGKGLKMMPQQRQKMHLRKKLLLIAGATTIVIFTLAVILFINISEVKNARAAATVKLQAGGFENGLSDWTSSGSGSWNLISQSGEYRSGGHAAQLTTNGSQEGILSNTNYVIQVPANGENYITVIAYAKASHCKNGVGIGIINQADGSIQKSELVFADTVWTVIEATFPVKNGAKYYPVLFAKRENSGPMIHINYDDLVMYCSNSIAMDVIPPTKPNQPLITASGTGVPLSWKEGTDIGSGLSGSLIIRANGNETSTPSIKAQSFYAAGETLGKNWKVVYNGNSVNSYLDHTDAEATYTYLVYCRDRACNYSAPLRLTTQGNFITNALNPGSSTAEDSLYAFTEDNNKLVSPSGWFANNLPKQNTDNNFTGRTVNTDDLDVFRAKAWYNQPENRIYTQVENSSDIRLNATVINIAGQIIAKQLVPANQGTTKINFDMNGLSNGIYTIILEGGEKTRALKVVKNW